ncbi:hypothetical protein KHC23_22920 [Ancylobacter dichloromethanicus]|uniref:Uncharacterized protein n=1 Tax=Ancylobacter dichloromethanicus TaxID=518825 RepID=A0A9W6JE11_9HYPH|nr:hypothetical protein [Ancylobacter dichloromethanicus]MBS7556487.1 hypothetical protein [Ancylobacter dichloromethanicus]GLK74706.1 hypothetical protein GCM10017643_48250 [Ancylobacter dichloromethanicus]
MSKRVTDTELLAILHDVKAKRDTLPAITPADWSTHDAHHSAAAALVQSLVKEQGARLTTPLGGFRLSLAGVIATCTSGHSGLILNWINAAYRELDRRRAA